MKEANHMRSTSMRALSSKASSSDLATRETFKVRVAILRDKGLLHVAQSVYVCVGGRLSFDFFINVACSTSSLPKEQ